MPLFKHAERSKQVINLFSYLLLHRFETISQERLIEALWPEDKSDDPANALKNLVYRLRKALSIQEKLEGNNCIIIRNGAYAWNTEIPCTIDSEEMENLYQKARSDSLPVCSRIDLYRKAISFYKGRFMEDSSYEGWIAPMSSYYQSLYMKCIREVTDLLTTEGRFEEIAALC